MERQGFSPGFCPPGQELVPRGRAGRPVRLSCRRGHYSGRLGTDRSAVLSPCCSASPPPLCCEGGITNSSLQLVKQAQGAEAMYLPPRPQGQKMGGPVGTQIPSLTHAGLDPAPISNSWPHSPHLCTQLEVHHDDADL